MKLSGTFMVSLSSTAKLSHNFLGQKRLEGGVVPFSVVLKRQPGDCYEGRIQDVTIEKVSMVPVQCACDLNLWRFAVVMACAQCRFRLKLTFCVGSKLRLFG
ncbi:unnamed protein product [Clavelina lepadiformis]|uniref:Uncharacterized protein n=1 Tax=Clavelina lepadiformis TaxID=159417 RepID=A0ABP0G5M7_CLALP